MLRKLKNRYRRWQVCRCGILPEVKLPTFTAGARSGIWTVCSEGLSSESVVYSFGVGDNIAWELAIIERFGVTVHAFDPTPESIKWVSGQSLPTPFVFHAVGVAGYDGAMRFALPRRGSRFNYRSTEHSTTVSEMTVEAPVRRIRTLQHELGHRRIDVLKIDIEGGEYAVIDDLLASGVQVGQLLVEFHHHFPGIGVQRTIDAVRRLYAAGFRIFHISERGLEMGLVHQSGI